MCEDFNKIAGFLAQAKESSKPVLIVTHEWPDGDAVGSASGMLELLNTNGFHAVLHIQKDLPDCYRSFLPEITPMPAADQFNDSFSMVLNLDASTIRRIGFSDAVSFQNIKIPVVTMDHHPDNEYFGTFTYVDDKACSTAEVVFHFAEYMKWNITRQAATMLLMGIITDTGCFRFSNTSASAHIAASSLMNAGADHDRIINAVYFSKPLNMVNFETELLHNHFKSAFNGRFVFCTISNELLEQFNINLRNTEQLIESLRGIDGVDVAALIKPTSSPTIFKVSIRSKNPYVSAGRIARSLKGGGHEMAAGCTVFAKNSAEAEEILTRHVKAEFKS